MGNYRVNQTVIMNRAVPGSGKTTITRYLVDCLSSAGLSYSVHSTDEFFMEGNRYVSDIKKLGEYHMRSLNNFIIDLKRKIDVVICDNTNLLPWQSEPYTKPAREYGYSIIFINLLPRELEKHMASQQITPEKPDAHNLPEDVIERNIADFITYNDLLDIAKPIDPNKHFVYHWDEKTCQRVRTGEIAGHFDSDFIITIKPDEYQEAKKTIGSLILDRIQIPIS